MVLYNVFKIFLILCMVSMGMSRITKVSYTGGLVNVMDHGAVGDGLADDTLAFVEAWKVVCGGANRLTLYVPERKTFLVKPIEFEGPCNSNVNVKVSGEIIAPDRSKWPVHEHNWLCFSKVTGLTIAGNGTINGNGINWWKDRSEQKPTALRFTKCNNLKLSGLKHKDSQRNHISITGCEKVVISGIHISAPKTSPNTDGIDISSSNNIHIHDCFIGTGDDCIAINGGTSFVNISSVSCGPGHGISIGSLGKDGCDDKVEEIHVKDSTFLETQNGVRIKTWEGGSGYARKISFHNITFTNAGNPVVIDQYYCPHNTCHEEKTGTAVHISDVLYMGLHGTSASGEAIDLNCDRRIGCRNVVFDHVNITCSETPTTSSCQNAHGSSTDTFPRLQCLHS